jgi:hypothetical protein
MRHGYGFEVILNSISIRIFIVHSRLDLIILTTSSGSRGLSFDAINQGLRDRLSLRRNIEPSPVHAVFDLDNPNVGVKGDLSFEPRLGFLGIDQRPRVRPGEHPVDAARRLSCNRLWRRPIEGRASIEVIDFDENSAGLRSAPPAQDGARPFHSAPTQISSDPNVGAQPHRA